MLGYLYGKSFGSGYFSSQTYSHMNIATLLNSSYFYIYSRMKLEKTEFRNVDTQTSEKDIKHSEHGESLKSRTESVVGLG
jgi:hypothetical protein